MNKQAGGQGVGHADASAKGIEIDGGRARRGERPRELRERAVTDPPHRGGRDPDDRRCAAVVQRVEPVEAEQESQDLLLTPPEAREMRLSSGRIDRHDG